MTGAAHNDTSIHDLSKESLYGVSLICSPESAAALVNIYFEHRPKLLLTETQLRYSKTSTANKRPNSIKIKLLISKT